MTFLNAYRECITYTSIIPLTPILSIDVNRNVLLCQRGFFYFFYKGSKSIIEKSLFIRKWNTIFRIKNVYIILSLRVHYNILCKRCNSDFANIHLWYSMIFTCFPIPRQYNSMSAISLCEPKISCVTIP